MPSLGGMSMMVEHHAQTIYESPAMKILEIIDQQKLDQLDEVTRRGFLKGTAGSLAGLAVKSLKSIVPMSIGGVSLAHHSDAIAQIKSGGKPLIAEGSALVKVGSNGDVVSAGIGDIFLIQAITPDLAVGFSGSLMIGMNDDGRLYGFMKGAGIHFTSAKNDKPKPIALSSWWFKAPGERAVVPTRYIPGENPPYKLGPTDFDLTLKTIIAMVQGKNIMIHMENDKDPGKVVQIDGSFTIEGLDKLKTGMNELFDNAEKTIKQR